jgi:hypothetical protein
MNTLPRNTPTPTRMPAYLPAVLHTAHHEAPPADHEAFPLSCHRWPDPQQLRPRAAAVPIKDACVHEPMDQPRTSKSTGKRRQGRASSVDGLVAAAPPSSVMVVLVLLEWEKTRMRAGLGRAAKSVGRRLNLC